MGNEDDGGLMDFGARFYDSRVGRFISPDPIKDVSSANAVNPYAYCANNPLRYTDKHGLSKEGPNMNVGADDGGRRGNRIDPTGHLLWDPFTGDLGFVDTRVYDYHAICAIRHGWFVQECQARDQAQFVKDYAADYNQHLASYFFNMVLQREKAKQDAAAARLRAALFGDVSDAAGLILYQIDEPGSTGDKVNGQAESDKIIREGVEQGKIFMALGFYAEFAESMVAMYRDALIAGGASVGKGAIIAHTLGDPLPGTTPPEPVPFTVKLAGYKTGFWQDVMVRVSNPAGSDWNVVGCYLKYCFFEVGSVWSTVNIMEAGSGLPGG